MGRNESARTGICLYIIAQNSDYVNRFVEIRGFFRLFMNNYHILYAEDYRIQQMELRP